MTTIERPGDSPNFGACGGVVPQPAHHVVLHWWGYPTGQRHDDIVAWLTDPVSKVSSHFVVSSGRITQILPLHRPSAANGHDWANCNAITIECDPNNIEGTIPTVVELLAHLISSGAITSDFTLTGHRDYYHTECPGTYYSRLAEIRQRAADHREESDMQLSEMVDFRVVGRDGQARNIWDSLIDLHAMGQYIQHMVAANQAAVEALASAQGADPAEITATVRAAVEYALDGIKLQVQVPGTVTIKGASGE